MFSSVTMGILDAALEEGRRRLKPRAERMSAFERVSWTEAVNSIWLAEQAFEGMARAIETGTRLSSVLRGKLAIAELARDPCYRSRKRLEVPAFPAPIPSGNGPKTFAVNAVTSRGKKRQRKLRLLVEVRPPKLSSPSRFPFSSPNNGAL